MKKVTASSGDVIDYDTEEESVTVNGEYLPYTKILSEDTQGRPLYGTKFPIILKKGQVWLSSENVRGYDSRYFGPVSGELIIKAIPVLLF